MIKLYAVKNKYCKKFKSTHGIELDDKEVTPNCSKCVYSSSRNCGMDTNESLLSIFDTFC